ncbi:MAG TPA: MATE family efflux transporter [Flavipsychrobacter sp.]|nr:MATE family efflux transporter [Flavipsychrobacter sp.]
MKVSVTNKDIIRLAAPISLALFIPQISFLANTAFLGRLGEKELGVNGLAGIFYLTLAMIGNGLNGGLNVQLARRAGEGDAEGLTKVFSNGILLAVAFSLGMMMISLWLTPLIFGYSLNSGENAYLSIRFLYSRVWGLPFLMLTQLINAFYISIRKSKYLIWGSLTNAALNILFDYLLIFGNHGFPEWGLQGAAVASIIAEAGFCFVMYGIFYFKRYYHTYPIHRFFAFDTKLSRRSLKVSAPLVVQYLFSIGGWQVFFIYIEHLGQKELAASQILRSIFGIVSIGTWAFASTCNTMVSNIIGQGLQDKVMSLIKKVAKLSFLYTVVVGALLLIFSEQFLALYRNDPQLIAFSIPSLQIIVAATLIMSVSTVAFNGVIGTGNTMINLIMEVCCVCTYLVYCYIMIERLRLGLEWAWVSEFVYWTSLLITAVAYLKTGRWKGKKV